VDQLPHFFGAPAYFLLDGSLALAFLFAPAERLRVL
jgi:hypothetical protein